MPLSHLLSIDAVILALEATGIWKPDNGRRGLPETSGGLGIAVLIGVGLAEEYHPGTCSSTVYPSQPRLQKQNFMLRDSPKYPHTIAQNPDESAALLLSQLLHLAAWVLGLSVLSEVY